MASARFAWGIDIGNRALKAIKLVRKDGILKVDDFEIIEHENVLSNAGDNKEALIQSALANFVQRHSIKGASVGISVSGVSSFARFIKLPPVEPKKIPEIVRFEAIQQIPFPLEDVEWSYQLFQTPDSPDVEVGIFAMRRELINSHIKNFTDVDLNVQVVQMNPLAVYNAMYHDQRLSGTTMIVDLGAENTDLIIADGETIWLRSIPIGGNNFTDVLVKSFKLPFAKAEELKRNANTSKYARQIFQAMRPVFADLVAEIQRSIGFYSSVHRDSRIKKIIALGGTFRLAGLQKYIQQNLQLDVEKINELVAGAPEDAKLAATFNQNLLSMASAYGLAIQAMGDSKITSSLLPQAIRREKMWKDKTKYFGAAAAVFVLGSALAVSGYYLRDLQFKNSDVTYQNNNKELADAAGFDKRWSEVQGKGSADQIMIQNTRAMLDYRAMWLYLPADIFGALPPTPAGYPSPAYLAANPRNTRPIILINKMTSDYYPDLLVGLAGAPPELGMTPPVAGGAAGLSDPAIPPASRGFVLTLYVTTPHDNGYKYVLGSLKPSLEKFDRAFTEKFNADHPKDKKNYYIAKVSSPIAQRQIQDDPARKGVLSQSYTSWLSLQGPPGTQPPPPVPRGAGFGGRVGGSPPPAPGAGAPVVFVNGVNPAVFIDRLTGEDRRLDWEMTLKVVVVIDPPPLPPQAGTSTASAVP